MSLKLVELQVALPRTQDIGKIQEQLEQRGQHMQEQLAIGIEEEEKRKRKQVNNKNKNEKAELTNGNNDAEFQQSKTKENEEEEFTNDEQHPYKGNIIDYKG
ncbi:hypothetical protein [Cytobacillus sp. IB215665]|uniref:hypothetical protein n=1 Tax=Cytobacillus sp. IB215665 TaxID=3097357 RepID=UPI002A17D8D5|nr:hypothetical protein [Cytobacillus sp. IB215665]MDX8365090.1 hypothetical protein [Cytobacillus sp. IB215665]